MKTYFSFALYTTDTNNGASLAMRNSNPIDLGRNVLSFIRNKWKLYRDVSNSTFFQIKKDKRDKSFSEPQVLHAARWWTPPKQCYISFCLTDWELRPWRAQTTACFWWHCYWKHNKKFKHKITSIAKHWFFNIFIMAVRIYLAIYVVYKIFP